MGIITTLERIEREVTFDDEAEARRYVADQAREGFHPAPVFPDGICSRHRYDDGGETITWTAAVVKQIYNGEATPAYREGDRVVVSVHGINDWQPVAGTVAKVRGHSLTVHLDYPNANRVRNVDCVDYEVQPA